MLIVNNARPISCLNDLNNTTLEFLPPNTTSFIELNRGIIKKIKTYYRGMLVSNILKAIEENIITKSTNGIDISSKINVPSYLIYI